MESLGIVGKLFRRRCQVPRLLAERGEVAAAVGDSNSSSLCRSRTNTHTHTHARTHTQKMQKIYFEEIEPVDDSNADGVSFIEGADNVVAPGHAASSSVSSSSTPSSSSSSSASSSSSSSASSSSSSSSPAQAAPTASGGSSVGAAAAAAAAAGGSGGGVEAAGYDEDQNVAARDSHSAIPLPGGGVWMNADDILDGPCPGPRSGHSAVVLGGSVYVFGGHATASTANAAELGAYLVEPSLFKLDLARMRWEIDGTEMILPSGDVDRILRDNSSLCVIGKQASDAVIAEAQAAEAMALLPEVMDSASDTPDAPPSGGQKLITIHAEGGPQSPGSGLSLTSGVDGRLAVAESEGTGAGVPCARTWHSADVYQGDMYLLGGCLDAPAEQQFWQYSPAGGGGGEEGAPAHGTWTSLPCPPRKVEGHSTVVLDGDAWHCLLVIGGGTSGKDEAHGSSTVMLFDFESEVWIEVGTETAAIEVVVQTPDGPGATATARPRPRPAPPRRRCAVAIPSMDIAAHFVSVSVHGGFLYAGEALDPPFRAGESPEYGWSLQFRLPTPSEDAFRVDWASLAPDEIAACFSWVAERGGERMPWSEAAVALGSFGADDRLPRGGKSSLGASPMPESSAVVFGGYRRRRIEVRAASTPTSAGGSSSAPSGSSVGNRGGSRRRAGQGGRAAGGGVGSKFGDSSNVDRELLDEDEAGSFSRPSTSPGQRASPVSRRFRSGRRYASQARESHGVANTESGTVGISGGGGGGGSRPGSARAAPSVVPVGQAACSSETVVDHHLTVWRRNKDSPHTSALPSPAFVVQNSGMQDYDNAHGHGHGHGGSFQKHSLFGPGRTTGAVLVRLPDKRSLTLSRNMVYPHYLLLGGDNNGPYLC